MTDELRECDLIMKGGATSGVVYPFAVTEIAKKYRLRQIGGASVGAIAATIAAAAEYRREAGDGMDGFLALHETAGTLAKDLGTMFQPYPKLRRPFLILRQTLDEDSTTSQAILHGYRIQIRIALVAGMALALLAAYWALWGFALLAMLSAVVGGVIWIGILTYRDFSIRFATADFGMCPGIKQPGYGKPAFTDWITDQIDIVAGRDISPDLAPLTIGDLKSQRIEVATMTTDLSTQRPYKLPFIDPIFYVRKSEMVRLLPARVIKYVCAAGRARPPVHPDDPADLFLLPVGNEFPVILMARLSMSFPGLITAFPIWRREQDAGRPKGEILPLTRLVFSDGGIGSNFPIHFFDAALPRRLTFGIRFAVYNEALHQGVRVNLPKGKSDVETLRTGPIRTTFEFISAMFNTAKDWRDTLQSHLPGYAERIVEIRLDKHEGGVNFTMDEAMITKLQGLGQEAGRQLVAAFSKRDQDGFDGFDRHRYLRAVSILTAIEGLLMEFDRGYSHKGEAGAPDYKTIVRDLKEHVEPMISDQDRQDTLIPLMEKMSELGKRATAKETDPTLNSVRQAAALLQQASMRIVANSGQPDSVPRDDPYLG